VSVDVLIQHAKRTYRIFIYCLSGCTIFFHVVSITALFKKKNLKSQCVL